MRTFYVISFKFLLIFGTVAAQSNFNTTDYEIDEANEHCDGYCFKRLKPILDDISETKTKLKNYEKLIQYKDEQILKFQKTLAALKRNEAHINETDFQDTNFNRSISVYKVNDDQTKTASLENESNEQTEGFKFQVSKLNISTLIYNNNVNQTGELEIQDLPSNCVAYENSTDINEIMVPNVGGLRVLCAKGGWTVVLNRFDGSENFYRNWADYRRGFGKLKGEFFIGLEALHHMTSSERYELHIELTDFHYNVREARYDNFVIGSYEDEYELQFLGNYTGNAGDSFDKNLGDKFTTFDRVNDKWLLGNSADTYASGGWFESYAYSNLFGKYFHSEVDESQGMWWQTWKGRKTLSSVKMMIRPNDE